MPQNRREAHGKPCPYCGRAMLRGHPRLEPTWDHVIPRSKNGREKIICCAQCNHIKSDMMPDEWAVYMGKVPMWWTLTTKERRAASRGEREIARTAKWGPRRARQGSPPAGPVVVPPELIFGHVGAVRASATALQHMTAEENEQRLADYVARQNQPYLE